MKFSKGAKTVAGIWLGVLVVFGAVRVAGFVLPGSALCLLLLLLSVIVAVVVSTSQTKPVPKPPGAK